jgi:hypothetical protein
MASAHRKILATVNAGLVLSDLVNLVVGLLANAETGTVVTVRRSGAGVAEPRDARIPAHEGREPFLATFVASHQRPTRDDISLRIEEGVARLMASP